MDWYMARVRLISRTAGWSFVAVGALALVGAVMAQATDRGRIVGGEAAALVISALLAYRTLSTREYKADGFPVALWWPGYLTGLGVVLAAAAAVLVVSAFLVGRDDLLTGVLLLQGAIALGDMGFIALMLVALSHDPVQ